MVTQGWWGGLKALDLTEIEKSWAQIALLTERLEISVPCSKIVAKSYSSLAYISTPNSNGKQS